MKKIISKAKHFRMAEVTKKILIIISSISIIDVMIAVFGGSYLSENVGTFLGKSGTTILSDLLFLEGSVVFGVGALLTLTISLKPSKERTDETEQPSQKRIHPSILLMIMGGSLIGLSIAVGTLFK